MVEWSKKFSQEALREIVFHFMWSYWPLWGAPVLSAVLAYLSGYDLAQVFLFALIAFGMIALALNNFSQWLQTRAVGGKVEFMVPCLGIKQDNSKTPPELHGIKMGVALRSSAPFPVEIRIDDLQTQIVDRVPSEAFYVRSLTVGPGIAAQFRNALIDLSGLDRANKVIHGRVTASATYGRPGKLRHPIQQQWYIAFKFDKDGNYEGAEPSVTPLVSQD